MHKNINIFVFGTRWWVKLVDNRPVRKFYRLQSKSTTAYKNTSREILGRVSE
ncbi:MAG: hypothetical protein LBR79_03355 [Oscillospiraceae bacterium]|nr:hypothetical protein [Oscillospiraceae bacterium]